MKFQQCVKIIRAMSPKTTVLIRGRHGIGKSQMVYQLGEALGLKVVERRLSQMSEGDMIGLPDLSSMDKEGVTRFNPADWYMECCLEPRLLFLDELNRATPEILQASFQVCGMRQLNGRDLHPESRVIACINASAEYTVNDMDPALLDRFWVADLEPDTKDWLAWAKTNVHPIIYDFIQTNEKELEHVGPIQPGMVYPSRRSWEKVSRELDHADVIDKPNSPVFYGIAMGLLGIPTAQAFTKYVKSIDEQLKAEDVLNDWETKNMHKRIEKFGNDKFQTLCEKIGDYSAKKDFTQKQADNLAKFLGHPCFPAELRISLWTNMVDRKDKRPENLKILHGPIAELIMEAVDVNQENEESSEDDKK